jgi:hypothetical protein
MRRTIVVCCAALAAAVPAVSIQMRERETNLMDAIRNTPLQVARQNLQIARSRAVQHCYQEAIPPLLITAEALGYFGTQEIGRSSGMDVSAGDTRQQILDYLPAIEIHYVQAVSKIDTWLDQVRRWSERRKVLWYLSGSETSGPSPRTVKPALPGRGKRKEGLQIRRGFRFKARATTSTMQCPDWTSEPITNHQL